MTHITVDIILFNELIMAYLAKSIVFRRDSLDDDGTSIIYSILIAKIWLN